MIAGIFKRRTIRPDLAGLADDILAALNWSGCADRTGSWVNDSVVLCATLRFNTPESRLEKVPFVPEGDGSAVAFWGRLTNRDELWQTLEIRGRLDTISDAEMIFRSYRKWGKDFIDHVYGDFSLAVYDGQRDELLCCTDHMGVKPLYYYIDDDLAVFVSSLTLFHRLKLVPLNPDMAWAARYILRLSMDFEITPYSGIFKLPPAHMLVIGKEEYRKKQYFSFSPDNRLTGVPFGDCLCQYRTLLDHAVKSRIRSGYPLGSESSGGIDSSTVTALAAKSFDGDLNEFHTFGYALLDEEPGLILKTSQKYQLKNNHIYCGRPEMTDPILDRSLSAMGYPCEHGNAIFHYPFYEACREKSIRTLLSGFGGDEFVTTIHGNIIINELLDKGKYRDVYSTLPGNKLLSLLRLIKRICAYKFAAPAEYCPRFLAAWQKRWPHQPLRPEVVKAFDLEKAYFDKARFDAGYKDLNQFTLEKRFAPFVPTRMNNCTQLADSYGVDYAWPLLDVRLISYFLSIPTEYKLNKEGRYFHRKAMDGVVPDAVNWKPSKHMGRSPFHPLESRSLPQLNTDLHPDLLPLIDPDAVQGKRDALAHSGIEIKVLIRRGITAINHLDLWLKKFHPGGVNWRHAI